MWCALNCMLEHYHRILEGREKSRYLTHMHHLPSLIERAEEMYRRCHFCEHRCGVNRYETAGACNVRDTAITSHFFHYGEERVLVPSYTIFFSGCNFSCVYCQNWDISQQEAGVHIPPERIATLIGHASAQAKNINWVGGEPTPHLRYILQVLHRCRANIPQVWNSNMYCSEETMDILGYITDVYLTDFKYGNDACAQRLSKVKRYWEVVSRNHEIAYEQGEVIIRHLVLPGHVECCSKPVIDWIASHTPEAAVNIMDQYYPAYRAEEYEELGRRITPDEYREVVAHAKRQGIHLL